MAATLSAASGASPFPPVLRPLIARLRRIAEARRARAAARRDYLRVMQELSWYSDRELAELGIGRSDIPAVAAGTYRRD